MIPPQMKAFSKPSVSATGTGVPEATPASVVDVAMAESAAMPSAPPICCDVLNTHDARPASDACTPASAAIEIGTNEKPSPAAISREQGRFLLKENAPTETWVK